MLPRVFFSTAVTNAGNSVVGSGRLITKTYFSRLVVPRRRKKHAPPLP
jgi:lipopolysaccharide transport system permease protein